MPKQKNYLYGWGYPLDGDPEWPRAAFKWLLHTPEDREIVLDMLGRELNGNTIGMVETCEGPYLKERFMLDGFQLPELENNA